MNLIPISPIEVDEVIPYIRKTNQAGIPSHRFYCGSENFLCWIILNHTTLGRAIYTVGGNSEAAKTSGIDVEHTKIIAYSIMGLLIAVAGIFLTGRLDSANAVMAEEVE